jgi:hypothetical protein
MNPTVTHYGAVLDPVGAGELLRAIDGYGGQPITKLAMQLAPHVFVRPGELRHAEWSEFDVLVDKSSGTCSRSEPMCLACRPIANDNEHMRVREVG